MAFVHGLVRAEENRKKGWLAPAELGEAAPHYVSFALPLDENGRFFQSYTCEVINTRDGVKEVQLHQLIKHGTDSFVLRIGNLEIWFAVRPVSKDERLPYVGKLKHDDFERLFTEIELEEPSKLDRLFETEGTFIIGCEPFAHYDGIEELAKMHSSS
jgi:hypothetical protein